MKPVVLVIDDEPTIRKLIEFHLNENYKVVSMENGEDALLWLQEGNMPDLILADIMMPKIDGYNFVKNIRSSGFFKDIPVIFLSSKGQSMDRIKGLKLGADDYLVKPFNPEELIIRIDNVLKRLRI